MSRRATMRVIVSAVLLSWASGVLAQTFSPDQLEVWKVEEQQWQMNKDKDLSWIEKMVHPNVSCWENERSMPQNRASLARWARYSSSTDRVLEQELFPISIVITGNIAVVQYYYQVATENYKKEREIVRGRYTDVLIKEDGRWLFLAWAGGDDPKK